MKLRLESALADTDDDELRTELVAADTEVDRLSAIVDQLLATASRAEEEQATTVNLGGSRNGPRNSGNSPPGRPAPLVGTRGGQALARFADVDRSSTTCWTTP